ncbi:hypothetical protein [Streptomyces sp. NPDC058861]|uniref:hypothetical protein n=1 Tax=Streptomyces sp. NPDC058861 TaxID=3346653 RepID=UPI0036963635
MSTWEKLFADADADICTEGPDRELRRPGDADAAAHESRRSFDVGAGLRRLAQDASYMQLSCVRTPTRPSARHRLGVMARVTVTQAGAASHVEELTALLGDGVDGDVARFEGWTKGVDIEGAQVFACMLYLAHHPESARFWWRFAAGAGNSGAAYCLYLDHLTLGDDRDARFWKRQVTSLVRPIPGRGFELDPEEFLGALELFTGYSARHHTSRAVPTGGMEADFGRLPERHTDDGLVCRPDARLADRIHEIRELAVRP